MMHSFFKHSVFTLRWFGWTVFATVMFFSLSLLLLRYWLLPDIERYRPLIAAAISQVAGQQISIERIEANWDGVRPYLQLLGVHVHDRYGTPVLILTELDGTVSWRSLLYGELRFREIRIERPVLIVRRDAEGVIHIAGVTIDQEEADNSFLDWLLRQRKLSINDADVYWLDEPRTAPALYLKKVSLLMRNQEGHHRFGLRVTPPEEVAAPMDIRGDFTGESVNALDQWRGRLFAQLDHVDLAILQTWLSFPEGLEFEHGSGAFRTWMGIDDESVVYWRADVNLHETRMHWAKDLPRLDLEHVRGRVGWKKSNHAEQQGEEWFAQHLSIATNNQLYTQPMDVLWQKQGLSGEASETHKLHINELDLGVVASLANYLPMEPSLQKRLNERSPKGIIEQAQIYWQGDWMKPVSFRVEGNFHDLAMNDFGKISSMSGISGSIEVTEQEGILSLNSDKVTIKLLEVLDEPLELDKLAGQVDWKTSPDLALTLLVFNDISFANRHISGVVRGLYQDAFDGPAMIDLEGELAHAQVNYLGKYTAYMVDQEAARDWLGKTIVAGRLDETRFHVRGDVNGFLSDQHSRPAVKLTTKITDATVKLSAGWPEITDMQANFSLQDDHLDMTISRARMTEIALKNARLQIANVHAPDPVLHLTGRVEGATQKIIDLIEKSPLDRQASQFSSFGKVAGNGKLQLALSHAANLQSGGRDN
jgi:uncharacterized protein YhdP